MIFPIMIIKMQNGEQVICEVVDMPQLGALQLKTPMNIKINGEGDLVLFNFIIGSADDQCIISKKDVLTTVPASEEMIEIYVKTILYYDNSEEDDDDDEEDGPDYLDFHEKMGL